MNIQPYRYRLENAVKERNKAEIEEVCFDVEFTQLENEKWLPEVFDLFSEALQNPEICQTDGAASLITSLHNDYDKLLEVDKQKLISIFDDNAQNYGDEMLRHSVGDFVARKYCPKYSMGIFKKWTKSKVTQKHHMAEVGLEVLIMAERLDSKSETLARSLISSIKASGATPKK